MDGNGGMNMRNWVFNIDPPTSTVKSHMGLELMSSIDEKALMDGGGNHHHHLSPMMASTNGGPFHHHRVGGISEPHIDINNYWMIENREKYFNLLSQNHPHSYYQPHYVVSPETSSAHSIQASQNIHLPKTENVIPEIEEACEESDNSSVVVVKRSGGKISKSPLLEKKPRIRAPRAPKHEPIPSGHRSRAPKKRAEVVINGINMDISVIPTPVCSCTGNLQQCYRWGCGGWQSACCTTGVSMYPLPMSTKRRGARIAGRKMSIGAFKKVLEKLSSDGYDFSNPIDLRNYWAKHGTNKFVTIR